MELAALASTLGAAGGAGLGLSVVGLIGQTLSGIQAARGQAAAAEAEAESIRESARFDEAQSRRRSAQIIAKQRAIGAASGIDPSTGTPLLLELDNARQAELEAQAIRTGAQNRVASRKFEARLARGRIPGIALSGVAKTGSVLSSLLTRKAP